MGYCRAHVYPSVGVGHDCRMLLLVAGDSCAGTGLMCRFPSCPAEVQLKPKHQPYKLGRQWPELLLRFTDAPDDDVATGQCAAVRPHLGPPGSAALTLSPARPPVAAGAAPAEWQDHSGEVGVPGGGQETVHWGVGAVSMLR